VGQERNVQTSPRDLLALFADARTTGVVDQERNVQTSLRDLQALFADARTTGVVDLELVSVHA
jgi:hypothetical protein